MHRSSSRFYARVKNYLDQSYVTSCPVSQGTLCASLRKNENTCPTNRYCFHTCHHPTAKLIYTEGGLFGQELIILCGYCTSRNSRSDHSRETFRLQTNTGLVGPYRMATSSTTLNKLLRTCPTRNLSMEPRRTDGPKESVLNHHPRRPFQVHGRALTYS